MATPPQPAGSARLFEGARLSFLIFASPKSGTTWLQRLLSLHPEALCTESRLFGDYYHPNPISLPYLTLEKYVSLLSNHFAPAVEGLRAADTGFYRDVFFNVIDTIASTALQRSGKRVYGEKLTPYHGTSLHAVEALKAYNPDVRFVNLTRDGRDVVVSGSAQWLNLRLRTAPESEKAKWLAALEHHTIVEDDFVRFLTHWTEAVTAGFAARAQFRHYLHLSYEALLADPNAEVTRLLEFLELDASPGTVQTCIEAASFKRLSGGRDAGQEDRHSFFRKGQAGDWASWFSPEQTARFEAEAGALLTELGYPLVSQP